MLPTPESAEMEARQKQRPMLPVGASKSTEAATEKRLGMVTTSVVKLAVAAGAGEDLTEGGGRRERERDGEGEDGATRHHSRALNHVFSMPHDPNRMMYAEPAPNR